MWHAPEKTETYKILVEKCKGKVVTVLAMKTYRERRGIASVILSLGA
jgi:hypothetical protein